MTSSPAFILTSPDDWENCGNTITCRYRYTDGTFHRWPGKRCQGSRGGGGDGIGIANGIVGCRYASGT
ncbi:uncharacterized protein UV8b_04810 [Ustilaginoidea virens]|uniref:Uncharacterized protein n=1 Tax=Ustilaginoidea virens TaxID=1159556 RepID=A0A8E5HS00_USTVR|nr:uncharacterized protein UV8b_04810 [Ustilaginoidea virens]QUC20569.1 hypothetical protein UV8b_04810 [Ustilaginoidea virens]